MSNETNELARVIHSRICEQSVDDCLEWRGRCVKAAEATLDAGYAVGVASMSDDKWMHTPTTAEVRRAATSFNFAWQDSGKAFDRWLAAHDAEIADLHKRPNGMDAEASK